MHLGGSKQALKASKKWGTKYLASTREYDYVAIGEFPSDGVAATVSLAVSSLGNVRITTLRAFTKEEFAAMVKKLP